MIVKIMLVLLVLQNEYMPPEWLPLLQVVCHRIGDEEEDSSIYFQLLSTMVEAGNEKIAPHIPDIVCLLVREISKKLPLDLEPWPQVSSYLQLQLLHSYASDVFVFLFFSKSFDDCNFLFGNWHENENVSCADFNILWSYVVLYSLFIV